MRRCARPCLRAPGLCCCAAAACAPSPPRAALLSWASRPTTSWKVLRATPMRRVSAAKRAAGGFTVCRGGRRRRRLRGLLGLRDPQLLAGVDLVGVAQHGLVGLEDHGVLVGVAIELLGK